MTAPESDEVVVLETNIDDSTGEALGLALNKLLTAGARDAFLTPIYMKKNRPAYKLTVIADEARRETLEGIIFRETSTIGLRRQTVQRTILPRAIITVATPYGNAAVKRTSGRDFVRYAPEFDSVAALAAASGRPFGEIYGLVERTARENAQRGGEAADNGNCF